MTPIYNATKENPYLVDDYPYGFNTRCRIRFWLEESPSRGFRMVSQTENPKNCKWNAPKPSTYVRFAAALFLDEDNHVTWTGISEYSEPEKALEFAKSFSRSANLSRLKVWALAKSAYYKKVAEKSGLVKDLEQCDKWREVAEACP